jgi:putative ABC transport system permease protein
MKRERPLPPKPREAQQPRKSDRTSKPQSPVKSGAQEISTTTINPLCCARQKDFRIVPLLSWGWAENPDPEPAHPTSSTLSWASNFHFHLPLPPIRPRIRKSRPSKPQRQKEPAFFPVTLDLDVSCCAALLPGEPHSPMNKLIFANLLHRPLRSIISTLAVAIEVIMILSIVAIFMGMLNDQNQRTNGIGADLMLLPSNASFFNGVSGAALPVVDAQALLKLQHVAIVSPVIQKLTTSGNVEILYGIDYASFNALKPFVYLAGSRFQGPNDVIIDNVIASTINPATQKLYAVGDTIPLLGESFRVSGIVEQGKGGRKLIPLETMQRLSGAPNKASLFYIKCDSAADEDLVMSEIHAAPGFENNTVMTIDSWLNQMTPDKIPGFNLSLDIVTGIAMIVGFLVIFQSMYTAVLERTREIGILKSMGASKAAIVGMVLRECAVLAIAGVVVGVAGTFILRLLLAHFFPSKPFDITTRWLVQASILAFCGSELGALYPAWMAARKDPIDALAYE